MQGYINEGKASESDAFTFGGIYKSWLELKKTQIKNWDDVDKRVTKYLLPDFGSKPLAGITPPEFIKVLQDKIVENHKAIAQIY